MIENVISMGREELIGLMDRSVRNVTQKVAGLDLYRIKGPVRMQREPKYLWIQTSGDYSSVISLQAEKSFLLEITKRMKRTGEAGARDIPVYTTEYFNILCGFFISHLNSYMHLKAKFGIPVFAEAGCERKETEKTGANLELYFQSPCGILQLVGINLPYGGI